MSLCYALTFAGPLTAGDVARELIEIAREQNLLDVSTSVDDLLEEGKATVHGTWLGVLDDDPSEDDPVADLGITPGVSVFFRCKNEGYETQDDDMTRITNIFLSRFTEDAVLHLEYDSIWLLRRSGELLVNDATEEWTSSRLALLPEAYRRTVLKFPSD